MNKTVTAKPGQTLFDVAIEHYGSTDAVALILDDNPHIENLTSVTLSGVDIIVRDPVPALYITNKQVAAAFSGALLKPATLYPII